MTREYHWYCDGPACVKVKIARADEMAPRPEDLLSASWLVVEESHEMLRHFCSPECLLAWTKRDLRWAERSSRRPA
jgi:hypothetical protein